MPCVVSDEEKAPSRRQVGIRKANASESLMKCRKTQYVTSKPGRTSSPGMSLAVTRLLARWCPAWRRREPGLRLLHGTWEGMPRYLRPQVVGGKRKSAKQQKL